MFRTYNQKLGKSESDIQQVISKHNADQAENKQRLNEALVKVSEEIVNSKTNVVDLIKAKEIESMQRHYETNDTIGKIEVKLKQHELELKKNESFTATNRKLLDGLSNHIEDQLKQVKEKQYNNEKMQDLFKGDLHMFKTATDKTHGNIRESLQVHLYHVNFR